MSVIDMLIVFPWVPFWDGIKARIWIKQAGTFMVWRDPASSQHHHYYTFIRSQNQLYHPQSPDTCKTVRTKITVESPAQCEVRLTKWLLASTMYEILATSTYSESFEGRLLQRSAKWGVQCIIFRRAGAHPGGISWTFTQSGLIVQFYSVSQISDRTRQVSPPLSSGGYQLLYRSRDCVHMYCTPRSGMPEPVLSLYTGCTHL